MHKYLYPCLCINKVYKHKKLCNLLTSLTKKIEKKFTKKICKKKVLTIFFLILQNKKKNTKNTS